MRVRITADTLWYDKTYKEGDEVDLHGRELLDLIMAGRVEILEQEMPCVQYPGGDYDHGELETEGE